MKKYLLMAVCIIMMSMTASAISINKALLDHNGTVTLYDGLQEAINASSDGDVIYLTLGTFKGPFTVSKKITIRGTGETSIIDGDVNISIPGSPKLNSPVLEALSVSGTVNVGAQVDDMIIRKCKIANFTIGAQIDGAVLDRCYITNTLTLSSYIKGMTIVNSKLQQVRANSGATQNTTFVNCNLSTIYPNYFSATIINSVIRYCSTINSSVLINSILNSYDVSIGSSSVAQNCYWMYNSNLIDSSCECAYDTSFLQSKGYLGTDGTVVGIYGGDTPFTLEPSVPKVTSSSLELDLEKKELNVKLTVSPQ
ncbi:MAG: hypothetical protein IJ907_03190 [Prevotella sp.]|nr:hypothetical protein [Prevotella sp.]